jgi:hypothetical protein
MLVFEFWLLLYAHRHQSGWSYYTDTSEPVDGIGAQNMVTVQSGFRTSDLSITGLKRLPTAPALTGPITVKRSPCRFVYIDRDSIDIDLNLAVVMRVSGL